MKKLLYCFIILLISSPIYAQQNYSFKSIKTFEAGYDAPVKDNRVYNSTFDKSIARFIWCEITLDNKQYDISDQSYITKWKFFNPDGSERGVVNGKWNIKKEWTTTWNEGAWGWDESGNWKPGTYKVVFYLDDDYIAQTSFTIVDYSASPSISFIDIKFFESEITPVDVKDRVYKNSFDKNTSRYIFYQIGVNNLKYNLNDITVDIKARYYNPDGSIRGEPASTFNISSDWKTADLWSGWGWDEAGNWPTGNYKVEIYYQDNLFAEGYFTIRD